MRSWYIIYYKGGDIIRFAKETIAEQWKETAVERLLIY